MGGLKRRGARVVRRARGFARRRVNAVRTAIHRPSPERDTAYKVLKSALAATVAWEIADNLPFAEQSPWMAPVTAMVVVGTTVSETFTGALQRVAATVVGVLVSYWAGRLLGLHWWSILIVVAGALTLGNWRRFGKQGTQVGITAVLILTLASVRHGYATARIIETLLGAVVGMLVNLLIAPPVHVRSAREALEDLAGEAAAVLSDTAEGLRKPWPPADSDDWLARARDLDESLVDARESVERATESVRFNPRRVIADVAPDVATALSDPWLRPALRSLEHVVIQTRGITRGIYDVEFPGHDETHIHPDKRFMERYADLLDLAARAVHRFGEQNDDAGDEELRRLVTDGSRRAHALGRALRTAEVRQEDPLWAAYGALLIDIERLFGELR